MMSHEIRPDVRSTELPAATTNTSSVEQGLNAARTVYWWILIVLIGAYCFSGVTEIRPGEAGLVRRFGRWTRVDDQIIVHRPGLLFALPEPFDRVIKVPVKQEHIVDISLLSQDTTSPEEPQRFLLTGDRSLLEVTLQARFRISDPAEWLMASADTDDLIRSIVTSATNTVCNKWQSDDILRQRRILPDGQFVSLPTEVLQAAQQQIVRLRPGAELTAVEFTAIRPPLDVRDAFIAVQDARVDQDAWREEALGEAAEVRLNAERMALVEIADARGRLDSVLGKIAAELELFKADLAAFEQGPSAITAKRLQRESWEEILRKSGRVITVPTGARAEGFGIFIPDAEKSR